MSRCPPRPTRFPYTTPYRAGVGTLNQSSCTTTAGVCTITVSSATTGSMTVTATTHVQTRPAPTKITPTRTTGDNLPGDSASAVKTWVDANIKISPLTPTNEVGIPHPFTVTVKFFF